MIVGIDPGISGALAFVEAGFIDLHDMPIITTTGKKAKNEINGAELAQLLRFSGALSAGVRPPITHAFVERVHAMPKQGVTSCFNFGVSVGIIRGVCGALGIPVEFITPQAWKGRFNLIGSEKDAARGVAIRLYPQVADSMKRKKDIGRADALLIARYGQALPSAREAYGLPAMKAAGRMQ